MPPRIFMVIAGLDIGGRHGGAERFGLELACSLARQNLAEVKLAAFWQMNTPAECAWQAVVESQGVPVFYCVPWRHPSDLFGFISGVQALECLIPQPVDIVHSHFQLGNLAAIWLKARKKTTFACRTAHITHEWGNDLLAVFLRWSINGRVYPHFLDAEAGVSQAVVAYLDARPGRRCKSIFIPNAVPRLYPAKELINTDRLPGEIPIGFIGRLTSQKDLPTLFTAYSMVKKIIPNLTLYIVGDGPLRPALQKLSGELGISTSAGFLGVVPDPRALLYSWRLLVLPSSYEGLPTVALEALANGIPVIGSDIPGTRDLIQPGVNGWLFPVGDAATLAGLICQVVSDLDQLRRMASACRKSAAQYNIDEIAKSYFQSVYPS
ncbi:MAG TPA: glycosyltransferase family 4 protein [Longilinea sp.]|nr:glycosyltransferase family 4 protein [Longilinea sp.]